MYTVYMLRTDRNTLYTGYTSDLNRRLREHRQELPGGAKYTHSFKSVELVFSEQFTTRSEAMKRECELKRLTKAQKEALVFSMKLG